MGKQSPNKRKSAAGVVATPKKQKVEGENAKTPLKPIANTPAKINTPKSAKKAGNKTPNGVNNNKTPQPNTPAKQANQPNAVSTGKKFAKKNKQSPNKQSPNKPPPKNQNAVTPNASPKKLQKFAGTSPKDKQIEKAITALDDGVIKTLSKRAKRRMKMKLKKAVTIKSRKNNTDESAEPIVKTMNPAKGAKVVANKNVKKQGLVTKVIGLETIVGKKALKKQNFKDKKRAAALKRKMVEAPKAEADDSKDEEVSSDEVETMKKPAGFIKTLNASEDDEDDDSDAESADEEELETTGKHLRAKKDLDVKDLNDVRIVKKGQSRYVIFAGNLPFEATKETLTTHFKQVCKVKDVRIPTDKDSHKPRGFAYVEVPNVDEYHKALALHHSFLNGRRINVLYTQGGQKNSKGKKQEIKRKNFKLQAMRRKGQLPGGVKDSQKRSVRRAKKRAFDTTPE